VTRGPQQQARRVLDFVRPRAKFWQLALGLSVSNQMQLLVVIEVRSRSKRSFGRIELTGASRNWHGYRELLSANNALRLCGETGAPSAMKRKFDVGDHVIWNSEAGRVSGKIVKVHTGDLNYKGYTHHASKDDPQYEIKSDKTDHVALHKGTALRRVRRRD
jgi:hypothetical protein